jgi:CBS domain containing-hemolysin-like protein
LDPEPSFTQFSFDTNFFIGIIGIIFLLFCTAMVAAAEVALFSLSKKDLSDLSQNNPTKHNVIHQLLGKPKKLPY